MPLPRGRAAEDGSRFAGGVVVEDRPRSAGPAAADPAESPSDSIDVSELEEDEMLET